MLVNNTISFCLPSPNPVEAAPSTQMLMAAFQSRSKTRPHRSHAKTGCRRLNAWWCSQREQRLVVGCQRPILGSVLPVFWQTSSWMDRKVTKPRSDTFLPQRCCLPLICKSSKNRAHHSNYAPLLHLSLSRYGYVLLPNQVDSLSVDIVQSFCTSFMYAVQSFYRSAVYLRKQAWNVFWGKSKLKRDQIRKIMSFSLFSISFFQLNLALSPEFDKGKCGL